jgi:hypothetical protein
MAKRFEKLLTFKNCHICILAWLSLNILLRIPKDLGIWLIVGILYFIMTQKYDTLKYCGQTIINAWRITENDVEQKIDSKMNNNLVNKTK